MTLGQMILSQLIDPFRIALIVALVFTALRNRAVTGWVVPLLAGLLFVAVIIPSTIGSQLAEPLWLQVVTGLVSNAVILTVVLGVWEIVQRLRRG